MSKLNYEIESKEKITATMPEGDLETACNYLKDLGYTITTKRNADKDGYCFVGGHRMVAVSHHSVDLNTDHPIFDGLETETDLPALLREQAE